MSLAVSYQVVFRDLLGFICLTEEEESFWKIKIAVLEGEWQ